MLQSHHRHQIRIEDTRGFSLEFIAAYVFHDGARFTARSLLSPGESSHPSFGSLLGIRTGAYDKYAFRLYTAKFPGKCIFGVSRIGVPFGRAQVLPPGDISAS